MSLERYKYNFFKRFLINSFEKIKKIPTKIKYIFLEVIPSKVKKIFDNFNKIFKTIIITFKEGNLYTRLSYFFIGIGQIKYKKTFKGIFYIFYEMLFIFYMIFFGWKYLSSPTRYKNSPW